MEDMMRMLPAFVIPCMLLFQIAQSQTDWVQTDGPIGGVVNVIDTTSSGSILVGTDGSGVFRSIDDAASWSRPGVSINNLKVLSFANLPGGTVLAGTSQHGILQSTDDGQTWQQFGLAGIDVQAIVVLSASIIYATGSSVGGAGVERTTNGGASWMLLTSGLPGIIIPTDLDLDTNGDLFFVPGFNGGVYRSTNGGDSWNAVNMGLDVRVADLKIAANGDLFAATQGGIYRSTDLGDQWTASSNGLPVGAQCLRLSIAHDGALYTALVGNGLVYSSAAGGQSWTAFSDGLPPRQVRALANAGGHLLAGMFGLGIYGIAVGSKSPGVVWSSKSVGFTAVEISDLTMFHGPGQLPQIIASSYRGSDIQSTVDGQHWNIVGDHPPMMDVQKVVGDVDGIEVVHYAAGYDYGTSSGGVVVLTTSQPQWQRKVNGLSGNTFLDIDVNPNTHKVNLISTGDMFGTTNRGDTWFIDNSGLPSNRLMLAVEYNRNEQKWYTSIGTNGGSDGAIYTRSSDNADWTISRSITGTFLTKMALNYTVPDEVAGIANSGIVYRCDGNGCAPLTNGFPSGGYASTIEYSLTGWLHAGVRDVGQFVFSPSGSWMPVGNNLPQGDYRGIKFGLTFETSPMVADTSIFVGIYGRGVYRLGPTLTGIDPTGEPLPVALSLEQNYPNPFNPATTITFGIPFTSHVSLKVYDVLGREVTTLVDENLQPGVYSKSFDGGKLSSGVYCYRLRAGDLAQTRKLLLLR